MHGPTMNARMLLGVLAALEANGGVQVDRRAAPPPLDPSAIERAKLAVEERSVGQHKRRPFRRSRDTARRKAMAAASRKRNRRR